MSPGRVAIVLGAIAAMLASLVGHLLQFGLGKVALAAIGLGLLVAISPRLLVHAAGAWHQRSREHALAGVQGRHHAFAGVTLNIEQGATHCWIGGDGFQSVLRTRDRDDVLAARLSGYTRRDERGRLLLRVDAVVRHLAERPDRMDPTVVRFRTYLEREVLYPDAQRRARR